MQNINLLNLKLKKNLQPLSAQKMGKYFILMFAVSVFAYSYFDYQLKKQEAEFAKIANKVKSQELVLTQLQQQKKPQEKDPTLPYIIRQAESDIQGYQMILAELNLKDKNKRRFSEYFESIAKNKIDGLWVNDFYVNNFSKEMEIGGGSTQPEFVSDFIKLLSQDKTMEEKKFQMLQMSEGQLASLNSPFTAGSNGGTAPNGEAQKAPFLQFKLESNSNAQQKG